MDVQDAERKGGLGAVRGHWGRGLVAVRVDGYLMDWEYGW